MLAVGKDVNAVGHRLAPMPMGPGDKPRDDSGMYSLKTKKPVPRFGGRSAAPFRKIPGGGPAGPALPLAGQPAAPPAGREGGGVGRGGVGCGSVGGGRVVEKKK